MTAPRPRPFRLTRRIVPEDELHAAVAHMLMVAILPPAEWTTFPAGGYLLAPASAARLLRLGLKRGWPDIMVIHGGAVHGIELKREGGKLSVTRIARTRKGGPRIVEGQADVHPRLIAAGMKIAVCRSLDEVLAALREWSIPMRNVS